MTVHDDQELSPAERYARAAQGAKHPRTREFITMSEFGLDPFQVAACESVEDGNSVLVAAPTGAGKTVVAEFAIFLAMSGATDKVFYTAPIKALSNQKFNELVAEYGPENVGLLTGDTNVNATARIVVMTTEVLRNMLYADSTLLRNLSCVVMDEVHYLADRFRGAVWEEIIIHLPASVAMVSLSATVSNAEEFGDWLQAVRGNTDVIVSEHRPVPLDQHVVTRSGLTELFDPVGGDATSADARVNPELVRLAQSEARGRPNQGGGRNQRGRNQRGREQGTRRHDYKTSLSPRRSEVVADLWDARLLPAIFFIFSRVGCDQAVQQLLRDGISLTTQQEADEIREIVEERTKDIPDADLAVLGYWEWLSGLERGIAAHHAGMLPAFKEIVEELFKKRLVLIVFATETLALGINMPARSVVLEKLEKFNGEARVPITPGEYTQLTGRAGRRGIDVEGHSVLVWHDGFDPHAAAALASRRSYPMNSSFRPTYNMAVNLIDRYGRERTREILESSFAQFQADRAVVSMARTVRQYEDSLEGYETSMACDRGDFISYARIREELGRWERLSVRGTATPAGDQAERAAQINRLRAEMKQHPCHSCKDRELHARWAERWVKLNAKKQDLSRQIASRTGAVATVFDRVTDVLTELGYLEVSTAVAETSLPDAALDDTTSAQPSSQESSVVLGEWGRTLKRIYGERDLLIAECLRNDYWKGIDVPAMAALCAALVYEPRREESVGENYLPKGPFREALRLTTEAWARLDDVERRHKLPGTDQPALGLCNAMYAWARGDNLSLVLREADMAAGDFVRSTKQTVDLLEQVAIVAPAATAKVARKAVEALRTGIVAYSSVVEA
ncbi:DEAD/DEAH box helicase [Lysinibacter cavernae]|uniref:ATP-dependent RNA helicase HelY n=1 Tax=Lysinibacter cavernae TaxID=1640652 RepID=A0A7X5QZD2_9MICO|nr:DEAD/DEAH box helicase [Lysinibacter cavernae]NIH52786.1 ATP-dependent RNA helicase HelY [Lysinibacter cavernae]